jgi:hypothetical protein
VAVSVAYELPDSPQATFELNKLEVTRKFLVESNNFGDGPMIVSSAPGIPRPLSYYFTLNESNPYVRCRSVDCERKEPNSLFWVVTAHYSTPTPKEGREKSGTGTDTDGAYENPLLELAEIETTFETVQMPVTAPVKNVQLQDANGNPVAGGTHTGNTERCQSSAGEIFVPPPSYDSSHLVLQITRNEDITTPHPYLATVYMDTCNSDTVFGVAPGTCKMKAITCKRETKQLAGGTIFPYLRVTYVIHVKATWDLQLLDSGSYYLDSSSGTQVQKAFLDQQGNPIQGILDGTGHKGTTPVYTLYRVYARQPFAPLNLPDSFRSVQ